MNSRALYALALLLLVPPVFVPSAVAQPQPVGCGTVIDTPGKYELTGDVSCELVPPSQFCDAAAITITAPHVELNGRGFRVSGIDTAVGIRIMSTDVRVQDIVVERFNIGIEITGGGLHHLENVTSRFNSDRLCGAGHGVQMTNTSDNRLSGSAIVSNQHWGVRLLSSDNNRLKDNEITDNVWRPGRDAGNIDLVSSDENVITDNDLSRGGLFGVRLQESTRNRIEGNLLDTVAPTADFGAAILLIDSAENAIRDNAVERPAPGLFGAHTGIHLVGRSRRNVVRDNDVLRHGNSGILLSSGAMENQVRANTALDNTPFDAADENPGCDENVWKGNQFGTVNQPACID
jgi:parallel beta-helix repeat protein